MKVAIVGSRDYPELFRVVEYVKSLPAGTIVVSGGARGVDSIAENSAKINGLSVEVFIPDWKNLGMKAGYIRNQKIVDAADRLVAFWDGKSRGTKHSIYLANKRGIPVEVKYPGGK